MLERKHLQTEAGMDWRYLRDVRKGYREWESMGRPDEPELGQDFDLIADAIIPAWHEAVFEEHLPLPEWECTTLPDGAKWTFRLSMDSYHRVLPSGLLLAAVPHEHIPPAILFVDNHPAALINMPAPAHKELKFPEHWFVGLWSDVALEPDVWGHGKTSPAAFTVRAATSRLNCLQRITADPEYVPGCGVRLKILSGGHSTQQQWPGPEGHNPPQQQEQQLRVGRRGEEGRLGLESRGASCSWQSYSTPHFPYQPPVPTHRSLCQGIC